MRHLSFFALLPIASVSLLLAQDDSVQQAHAFQEAIGRAMRARGIAALEKIWSPVIVMQHRHQRSFVYLLLYTALVLQLSVFSGNTASAQQQKLISCKPVAERTQPEGCWIMASKPLGKLAGPVFWTLDVYPTQESAEKANTNHGTVVPSLGRIWLFTVGEKPVLASQGSRITEIGPIPVKPDEAYTAQFAEGILEPGSVSRTHVHAGTEVFYTEAGESCLETPAGKQIGLQGTNLVVPEGTPMELVATGPSTRRGLILVLHSSDKPATTMVTDWKSKGLCMASNK